MRENEMSRSNIFGSVVFILGFVLIYVAWRASNAPVEQMSEALTGRYTDNTMLYLLAGIAGIVAGGALLMRDLLRS
jgi:uncharacterized membrane protein